jgi:hypothetical protein
MIVTQPQISTFCLPFKKLIISERITGVFLRRQGSLFIPKSSLRPLSGRVSHHPERLPGGLLFQRNRTEVQDVPQTGRRPIEELNDRIVIAFGDDPSYSCRSLGQLLYMNPGSEFAISAVLSCDNSNLFHCIWKWAAPGTDVIRRHSKSTKL